jgi:hypothetical protein
MLIEDIKNKDSEQNVKKRKRIEDDENDMNESWKRFKPDELEINIENFTSLQSLSLPTNQTPPTISPFQNDFENKKNEEEFKYLIEENEHLKTSNIKLKEEKEQIEEEVDKLKNEINKLKKKETGF